MIPDFLAYDFMQRALFAGLCVAVVAPLVGTFLVMRRYSMMADTMAHVSLIGIVIGLLSGIAPPLMALVISILAAYGIEKIRDTFRSFGDAALSLVLSGSLAVSIILISTGNGSLSSLNSYLFGSLTTVTVIDMVIIAVVSVGVCGVVAVLHRHLFIMSFDEEIAQADGIPVRRLHVLFLVLIAAAVSVTISTVGVLLMGALMVVPVLTAMRGAKSFQDVIIKSIIYSVVSVVAGLVLSFYIDVPTGGMIVVVAVMLFLIRLVVPQRF